MNKMVAPIVLAAFASTVLAVIGCAIPQDQQTGKDKSQNTSAANRERAMNELNQGVKACRESRYAEAQQHFVKSLEFDPTQKNAPLLIARAIHAQYRPNDADAANLDKARQAIAAYQKVLAADPQNEEAYSAMISFYIAVGDIDNRRSWLIKRAADAGFSNEKRSEAYTLLASIDWDCSYEITTGQRGKQDAAKGDKAATESKILTGEEHDRAKKCATRGLEMAEKALALNPANAYAWSYKGNLLLETARLAEMEGKPEQKSQYAAQANHAHQRSLEINKKRIDQKSAKNGGGSGSVQTDGANSAADKGSGPDFSDVCMPETPVILIAPTR